MKIFTLFLASFFSITSFAQNENKINDFEILGKWECTTNLSGIFVQTDTITYYRNNRFNAEGTVMTAINFATLKPEAAAYSTKGNGSWSIKDGFFMSVVDEFEAVNINTKNINDKFLEEINKSVQKGTTTSASTKFINNEIWLTENETEKVISLCIKAKAN